MKTMKDYYEKTATGWSQEFLEEKNNKEIIDKFTSCFIDGGTIKPRILDLGCGVGYDAKLLSDDGAVVVGVDLSKKSIEIAKQNVDNCKFFVGDITDDLSKLGMFDGVLCLATIMHINIEKLKKTFENIANVLHVGGLLLVSSYDGVGKNIKKSLVKFNNESYDQNINNYNAETVCSLAFPNLRLVDTWKFDDFDEGVRYFVFEKVEVK